MSAQERWQHYRTWRFDDEALGVSLDLSRMGLDGAFIDAMRAPLARAFDAMEALESGAIANPDEGRMVGHYWLRDPSRAPTPSLREAIELSLIHI